MASRGQILNVARALGDTSSATGVFGEQQGIRKRLWARGVGRTAGRLQAGLGIWGLAGIGLIFNFLANRIQEVTSKDLYVGTAVKYGRWLNDGTKHMPKEPWWDEGVRSARRKLQDPEFDLFGNIAQPPPIALSRSTLYQGQQFVSDLRGLLTGGILARLATRFAGSASARLFFGALLNKESNAARAPAILIQRECMKQIKKRDLIDTGCLLNSIAVGRSREDMLARSRRGCLAALAGSGEGIIAKKKDLFV